MKRIAVAVTATILIWLTPGLALATVCVVDPTGTNPSGYPDAQSALLGPCDDSNGPDTLIFECPVGQGPCEHQGFLIAGRPLKIQFAPGDPSVFEGSSGAAIDIRFSQVDIAGTFKAVGVGSAGIEVLDSELRLQGATSNRAVLIGLGNAALSVIGKSTVDLERVELRDSELGFQAIPDCSGNPALLGRELWIANNQQAGIEYAVPGACPGMPSAAVSLELGAGLQPNYIEGNDNGFETRGRAELRLGHTIFLSNFRSDPVGSALLRARDNSRITAAQILAYDNDAWPDPGQDIPGSPWLTTTLSRTAWASDNAVIEIRSSTLAHNQIEESLHTDGNGLIRFLSSISYQSGNKGVSASLGLFVTDSTSTVFGSGLANYDCACCTITPPTVCTPFPDLLEIDPAPNLISIPGTSPWPAVREDLYLMNNVLRDFGPGIASKPLYPLVPWSVDGVIGDALGSLTDGGYHNPCPSC